MILYKKITGSLVVLYLLFSCLFSPVLLGAKECFSPVWPHENSDLQPDPSLIFGQLDNGFRYLLKKNQEPKDRVAIYLDIQAGSLNESDTERGYAHFLEHMLFNGSTHFPPGKLVEYFQSIGMSFGGDINAHTGFNETVYDIILPAGGKKDIEQGLLVLSDYARGALLLDEEVTRELGVILAEKRSRDSAGYRSQVKEIEFSMSGTLLPERMPIGTVETLEKTDHAAIKKFYDSWYRPENMVLVMVGDFEVDLARTLVEKQFSQLVGEGPIPKCPDFGLLEHNRAEFYYHHESEMGVTETAIETIWNQELEDDSFALQVENLKEYLGANIVQYRLDELSQKSETPFTSAQIYSGVFLDRIGYGEVSAKSAPEKWQQSLTLLENTLRQALQFGFRKEELERVKKELLASMDSDVLTASSRDSKELASSFIQTINRNRVIRSPEQEKEQFGPIITRLGLDEVETAFRRVWEHPTRLVKVSGNALISATDPLATVQGVYQAAVEEKVASYQVTHLLDFPYLQLQGGAQAPVSQEQFAAIDSKRFLFANGVVLNLKKTTFQENEVRLSADFGLGKASEPLPGLSLLTESVVNNSGTATLSKEDLDRILAGSSVKMNFRVAPAAFSWQGKALNKDLELLFQVLQSLLVDPGVDEEAFKVGMGRFTQMYEEIAVNVDGVMKLHGESFLAAGNAFFGLPSQADFSRLTVAQIQEWLLPAALKDALEISLVGDFDEKEVLALVGRYFSVLPPRSEKHAQEVKVDFPKGQALALTVPSSIDKGMLVIAWKSDDFWDITRTRGLHMLAEIFSDKLRRVVRERLGATYSPQVFNLSSRIYPGYGVIQARLIVDPGQIEVLEKEVLAIAKELWQGKISIEELERAKGPMLTALKDMVRSNDYWLQSVLTLSKRYPQQLDWPSTILSGFGRFTVEELQALSRSYLDPKQAAVITVIPEKTKGSVLLVPSANNPES
ncbi:MAG: insulinase family protein [Proteobacteria bacterium]|nr:insulinase family protein [Pseudomonadota bacterium]MBU1058383.1 insulinase family protein [Pseudomonadota bacterium]